MIPAFDKLIRALDKLIRGEALAAEERKEILDWFARQEEKPTRDVVSQVATDTLLSRQVITDLSKIANQTGLQIAGEFRSGNGATPGDGFTGGRFGWPGFTYGSVEYFLAGVSNDALQVGLSLTDGKIYAGNGSVVIDSDGIVITNSGTDDPFIIFRDSGGVVLGQIYTNANENLALDAYGYAANSEERKLILRSQLDGGATNISTIELIANSGNTGVDFITLNTERISLNGTVGVTVNGNNVDADFTVNGDVGMVAKVDAGLERLEIGSDHYFPTRNAANKNGFWNEANQDMDFVFEGTTDANLLKIDAGLDAIGIGGAAVSGQKLTVYGDLHTQGDIDIAVGRTYKLGGSDILAGWIPVSDTWTRTGSHTFTISGDLTATFRKGTKIRYNDGAVEYGVVASSSHAAGTTTVNLVPNTDYLMANTTITNKYISYIENPEGFPQWFAFDAAPSGFSVVPPNPNYRWTALGEAIFIAYVEGSNGTSNATTFTATAPIAPVYNVTGVAGTLVDNGALLTTAGRVVMTAGSTAITFRTDMANGAWTNANGKRALAYWFYEY